MLRLIAFLGVLCAATTTCLANDLLGQLPAPQYHKKPSDPPWLAAVVQLHGHLGPWVVAGARLGMAGARAVDAKGHFDAEVTCEGPFVKPPQSCFLDGVQLGTGATLGKRTIQAIEAKQLVVKVRSPRTKKAVEVRPSQKLMDMLTAPPPESAKQGGDPSAKEKAVETHKEEWVEQIARDIAMMPDEEMLTISRP